MEASLLVIMLDWFKAVKSYEWIQKKKKSMFQSARSLLFFYNISFRLFQLLQ